MEDDVNQALDENESVAMQSIAEGPASKNRLAPEAKGSLNDCPARFVIDHLYKKKFTGHLLFSFREKKKKLWFSKGEVFRVQSNLVPELFGHMMIERGWINEVDLKICLQMQKETAAIEVAAGTKRLGDWVRELHGISEEEIQALHDQQVVSCLLQAMTWDEGSYEFIAMDLRNDQPTVIPYADLIKSLHCLLDLAHAPLGPLFDFIPPWEPKSLGVDLVEVPLCSILAGCRIHEANGILSIRKQNRLYEIVIKHGVPLTLYEGSFGQPRQTIVVRQASEEHERYFIDQVFRLFSFLTGTVHFRSFKDVKNSVYQRHAPIEVDAEEENVHVTRSVKPEDLSQDFGAANNASGNNAFKNYWDKLSGFALQVFKR